ncbi:MAG: apolipoprotein N-acyltransferase [Bdellovibrionaceae bacterium]|nr:apolipoprotein N-acyltransferase [Pseudobdellovibrionaceae bacterium]
MMLKLSAFFNKYRWPLFSGLLIGTTYIPFPPWAVLFCYAPLWIFLFKSAKNWKEGFIAGWLTQFTLTIIGFHWIAYTAHRFGGFPWIFSVPVLLLFAAAVHVYIPIVCALVVYFKNRYSWSMSSTFVAAALGISLMERFWPSIFPWNLGYTMLWADLPVYNWADVIGFEGLSSLILLLNAWFAWIWAHRNRTRLAQRHVAMFVVLILFLNVTGFLHSQTWKEFDRTLKVSIIQANIGDLEKVFAEQGQANFQTSIITRFTDLTEKAVVSSPNTELIVWPETAFPDYLNDYYNPNRYPSLLAQKLKPLGKMLLTGGYGKDLPGSANQRRTYNSLFLVDSAAKSVSPPYNKTFLLAYGEYFPFSDQFPILLKWFPFISNFGRGLGPDVLRYPHPDGDLLIGGQICYEGLYPEFTRGLAEKHADILANVTNDSWFGKPFEPYQHLYMTLARAIEVRRPLIRSTNTGISTVILADGTVLQQSPLHVEWHGTYDLRLKKNAPTTDFVLWGHYTWVLLLLAFLEIIIKGMRNARTHRP